MNTGYGTQTALWTPRLRDLGHDVAIAGYAGCAHMHIEYDGITVYASSGAGNAIGMDVIGYYFEKHQADLVISLCDCWALSPKMMALMPSVCWTPLDCVPLSDGVRKFLDESGAQPVAMSRMAQRRFAEAGYNAAYIPHGIDTRFFVPPPDREKLRELSGIAPYAFVVVMNQANRSGLRKALDVQLSAFAQFHERHPDSVLYANMALDNPKGQDLPLLCERLGLKVAMDGQDGDVHFPDQGAYAAGEIPADALRALYGVADVTLQAVMAGGFEIPIAESEACGTPVITTGVVALGGGRTEPSAMSEVAGPSSWLVGGQEFWVEERHQGYWTIPYVREIDAALEEAWQARHDGSMVARRAQAREHAVQFWDVDRVLKEHWVPFLERLEAQAAHRKARKPRPEPAEGRKIWAPVMFRDELDMLEMRLEETKGWVDHHVVVESERTHRGHLKPLLLRDSLGRFAAHKNLTLVSTRLPDLEDAAQVPNPAWEREHRQRDAAWPMIDAAAADGDYVLICDVDEIPSLSLLQRAKAGLLPDVCAVRMRTTLHAVDWEVPQNLIPPTCVVATAGYIRVHGGSLAAIRDGRDSYPVVNDGGWHFSWTGGPAAAVAKLDTATCHTEILGTHEETLIREGRRWSDGVSTPGSLPVVRLDVGWSHPQRIRERRVPPEWFRPRPALDLDDTSLVITAYKRPDYLERTLASWVAAEGTADLRGIYVALAPSDVEDEQRQVIAEAAAKLGRDITVLMDSPECALSWGPHRAIGEAGNAIFSGDPGCRFLVFSEEDIVVSDDVLAFMSWGRHQVSGRALMVCAHNALGSGWQRGTHVDEEIDDTDADQEAARLIRSFSPWCWGTWRDVWQGVLEPGWSWDATKGPDPLQCGYDWQLQRITERDGPVLVPDASRSQNIGQDGGMTADAADFAWTQAKSFREHRSLDSCYRLEEAK